MCDNVQRSLYLHCKTVNKLLTLLRTILGTRELPLHSPKETKDRLGNYFVVFYFDMTIIQK